MKNKNARNFCIFLFCTALLLTAGGRGEKNLGETPSLVRITGVVRLVGSSHFPEIVITGSDREWYTAAEDSAKLFDLQQRTVTVEGEETIREMTFASGLPAGSRRELHNIRIIEVHY